MSKLLKIRFLVSALLGILTSTIVYTQSYYFQQYSVGEGLPQSQVYALHQDTKGYLWLGTQGGGLAHFDGTKYISYTEQEGIAGNYINSITEGEDGQIWIGSNGGVSRFDGIGFQSFKPQFRKNTTVQELVFDKKGKLWAATDQGIYYLEKDSILQKEKRSSGEFGRMYAALADSRGQLWMGGEKGIFRYDENSGKWQLAWSDEAEVLDIIETPNGQLWAVAFNYGLIAFNDNQWSKQNIHDLSSKLLQCLWASPDGNLWLGTQDAGVFVIPNQDSLTTNLNTADGLCNNNIKTITGDIWGNVWIGTSGSGVCKYGGQEFEHLTRQSGLKSNFVYALANDTSGGLWLSAGNKGFSFYHNNLFSHFGRDSGFIDIKCRAIHQDGSGQTWIGTEGAGLATFYFTNDSIPERKFLFLDKNSGLAGNWVRDIASDSENEIWIATTDGGISRVNYDSIATDGFFIKNFGRKEGITDPRVHALHFDKWGRLWFGTQRGGIGMAFKDQVKMLEKTANAPDVTVRCLTEDDKGFLWCGTEGHGIGRAAIYSDDAPQFDYLSKSNGLISSNIYLLKFDELGDLWVGSERGVDKLKLDASRNIIEVRHFGYSEGFRGVETCQNASLIDIEGNLWFGTINGLMRYRPLADTTKVVKPKVHFTGVNLFYEPLFATPFGHYYDKNKGMIKGSVFPHDQNHLGFEFFAPNFPNPEKTSYSWQMVGQEENWSPFSKRNEVSYANLIPGNYTFQVRAKNEKDIIGDTLTTSFIIQPPYWETWWFRITSAILLVLLVGGIFWMRIKQVRKKAAQEKAQLELQNHLLILEQKARQLQMNPHFIFNALNSIQSLVSRKDFDGSRAYILKFGRLMRAVLDNSRQAAISLEKEIDTLQKYLEMEQFCRDGNFDFSISKNGIESEDIEIPPMLLQPFVENAILHGVAPLKDRRGMIEIIFNELENKLQVVVKDNGVGFPDSENTISKNKKRTSAGIAVTKERINILNGELTIENGKKYGTQVCLEIPV